MEKEKTEHQNNSLKDEISEDEENPIDASVLKQKEEKKLQKKKLLN